MTRTEMMQRSLVVARQSVPMLAIDARNTLYDQSVAEQRVAQAAPGAIRRTSMIALDANSTTGQYPLPADTQSVDKIWFQPANDTTRAMREVRLWPYDAWLRRVTFDTWWNGQIVQVDGAVPDWFQGSALICSASEGVLYVEPLNIAGTLTLRYEPMLTPYAPSSPAWSAYGSDPEAAMSVNGLDDESLGACADGIILWCAAKMLRSAPGGIQLHRAEILDFEAQFERSIWPVASAVPGNINNTRARPVPIGGRF